MIQPDLHHEGPLTTELLSGLMDKIKSSLDEIVIWENPNPDADWRICQGKWVEVLQEAGLRSTAIFVKLSQGIEYRLESDHKSVDIILCILRDYEEAKAKGFEIK